MEVEDLRIATLYLYLDPPVDFSVPVQLGTRYDPEGEHRGWRPVYVGQTIQPLAIRDRQHRRDSRTNFDKEYTETSNMQLVVLEERAMTQPKDTGMLVWLDEREVYYIKHFRTYEQGLNFTRGGGQLPKALAYIDAALKRQQIRWTAENGIMAAVRHAKATQPDGVNVSKKYTCFLTKLPLGKLLFKSRSRLHYVPKECYRELVELGWDLAGLRHHKWYKPNGLLTAFRSHSVKYGHINVRQDYVCPLTCINLGIRVRCIRRNDLHIPEECEHEMRQELHFWDSDAEYDWLNPVTGKMVAFRYAHKQLGHIDVLQTYRCPITKHKLGMVVSNLRAKAKGDMSKTKVPKECHHELCVELRFYWKHEDRVPEDAKWEGPHGYLAAARLFYRKWQHLNVPQSFSCKLTQVRLGAKMTAIRYGQMPPECMRELREKHFMFSPTNLFKHVYMCLQYDMPEVKQEDVRALDPWNAQVTPAEARLAAAIRRLLEEVSEQHPIWVQKADTRTFVPFGKKPLDVQQRYLADRQKAVSILGKRGRT
jgi:hypothetical protein